MRVRRIVLFAGALAALLALVIPVTGYYIVFMRPLQETALVVSDRSFSWGDYLTRTRMIIAQAQASGAWQPETLNSLLFDMVEELERQELIRQFAPQEGVTVTDEEVEQEVRARVLGRAAASDPNVTESEFQERYRRRLELLKVSEGEFEEVARSAVMGRKLEEILRQRVPGVVMQRHLYVIEVDTIDDANAVLDRVDAGEDFSAIAREVSTDTATKEQGGDLGWVPEGVQEEYDAYVFSLGDGEISPPLFTQSGVTLLQAIGGPEIREVRPEHRSRLESQALQDWLLDRRNELLAQGALQRPGGGLTTERYNWVLGQLAEDRELFPRRTESG
jgi:parvulin-like peptidyl-prolyl isomerase